MGTNFAPTPQAPPVTPPRPSPAARPRKSHGWLWFLILLIAGGAGYRYYTQSQTTANSTAKAEKASPKKGGGTIPVVAATARRGDFPMYLTGLGSATAYNTVTVRSRVDGELLRVNYTEGQLVKKGDLLAQIDGRPYEAQLLQYEGQLARDTALLENARADQRRYEVLVSQGVISRQQADTQIAVVHQYEGTVKADQGLAENIKVQLVYTKILAPISGRIGLRLVDPGNIVRGAEAAGMCTITQLQPIAVVFNLAQDYVGDIMKKWRAGVMLPVEAWDRDMKNRIAMGKLLTVDNVIDTSTGTARLKAEFPNNDNALFPNQFVNARLLIDTKRGVIIVPTAAVQHSPDFDFVYIVKEDRTVEMRKIKQGLVQGDAALIDDGVQPGEVVVTDGVDKLQAGTRVEPRMIGQNTPGGRDQGAKGGEGSKAGEAGKGGEGKRAEGKRSESGQASAEGQQEKGKGSKGK